MLWSRSNLQQIIPIIDFAILAMEIIRNLSLIIVHYFLVIKLQKNTFAVINSETPILAQHLTLQMQQNFRVLFAH